MTRKKLTKNTLSGTRAQLSEKMPILKQQTTGWVFVCVSCVFFGLQVLIKFSELLVENCQFQARYIFLLHRIKNAANMAVNLTSQL